MKSQNAEQKNSNGFTLIEVVISITLLGLMMAVLSGAFHLSHRASEKGRARADESQRLRSVVDLLGSHIRSAHPYRPQNDPTEIFFQGDSNTLIFVSALSVGMGGRGMSRITISWGGEGDQPGTLTLEEEIPVRFVYQPSGGGYTNTLVIGETVTAFRIEYLDPEDQWLERWYGWERKSLPRALRLTFRVRGEEVRWIFPIMVSALAR